MNNEQFVASLSAEQNTALLAFRDSINSMHAGANSALVAVHAEQLEELRTQLSQTQSELDAAKESLAIAESRVVELLA